MPTKRKPSDWQQIDEETLYREARNAFTQEQLGRISDIANVKNDEAAHCLHQAILNIAELTNKALHEEQRPIPGQKKDALARLGKALETAAGVLNRVDGDTRGLVDKMAVQISGGTSEPPVTVLNLSEELQRFADAVSAATWVAPTPKSGPPEKNAIRHAVDALARIWEAYTDQKATVSTKDGKAYGPFLNFCAEVLQPILSKRGMKASCESAIRAVLYGDYRKVDYPFDD